MENTEFCKNRIFLNDIDSYHGRYLASHLSTRPYLSAKSLPVIYGEDGPPTEVESIAKSPEPEKLLPEDANHEEAADTLFYEVVGTTIDHHTKEQAGVKIILQRNDYLNWITNCGVIILDISLSIDQVEEVEKLLTHLEDHLSSIKGEEPGEMDEEKKEPIITVILISTVMTWALTKSIQEDETEQVDDDGILKEDMYKKRIPAKTFKNYYELEEKLLEMGDKYKERLRVLIVGSGFTYGCQEHLFYHIFQVAWEHERVMPIFGNGLNRIPVIHVKDLALVIGSVLHKFPENKKYIIALEKDVLKQKDIIFAIGTTYGSGYFELFPKQEVLFLPNINEQLYFSFTVDLNIMPSYIVEDENMPWTHTFSFLDDIHIIYEEFIQNLNLRPHKVLIYGPPASGKTRLAHNLSSYYGLPVYSEEILNKLIVEDLKWKFHIYANLKSPDTVENEIGDDKGFITFREENVEELKNDWKKIQELGYVPQDIMIKFLQDKVASNESKNKGWIIEGFPYKFEQCEDIFGNIEMLKAVELEGELEGEDTNQVQIKAICPDVILRLEALDLDLCERVMMQREKNIMNTQYNERDMLQRLKEFRATEAEEINLLTYFEELNIKILNIDVIADETPDMRIIFDTVVAELGDPCTTYVKEEEMSPSEAEYQMQKGESQRIEEIKNRMSIENVDKKQQWSRLYGILMREEQERARIHAESIRQYLIQEVFPVLTRGLALVAKLRPTDPINFLAEYLFRENETGKMFNPGYNLCADHLMIIFDQIKGLIDPSEL